MRLARIMLAVSLLWPLAVPRPTPAQSQRKGFTLADDIGLTHFAAGLVDAVLFSPDERLFSVSAERGRLDLNRPEASLRVYRTDDIRKFLRRRDNTGEPAPILTVTKSSYKSGPIVSDVRWLADSSGLAFLAKTESGNDQLWMADVLAKDLQPLTPEDQHVTGFDVRSRTRYVYTVLSASIRETGIKEGHAAAFVGTGRMIESLEFPEWSETPSIWLHDLSELWAVLDGQRLRISDGVSGAPLPIHLEGQRALALSPDGRSVITALTVPTVPAEWESRYPPPSPSFPYRIRAGHHDPGTFSGQRDVSEYVLIDLPSGKRKPLTHAPLGNAAGWWGMSRADWAGDGRSVVLSNTFLPAESFSEEQHGAGPQLNRPCVVAADLVTGDLSCVERIGNSTKEGEPERWQLVYNAQFVRGNRNAVTVEHLLYDGKEAVTYRRSNEGSWLDDGAHSSLKMQPLEISVRQGLNTPPVLIATDNETKASRILWDPNPQLKSITMGEVSIFQWKDETGRDWIGGLYKPPDYRKGKRYPLVIQNHGFDTQEFRPSGAFTTAFAAQELAASGFLVLQIRDCPIRATPEEGPCQVAGYEAAVRRLVADEMVDPQRVGIIGFSRTCFYVLQALTTSKLHFAAASITDGVNEGYLQYLLNIDIDGNDSVARDTDTIIGASPFGQGLQQWLERSPEFHMDNVTTPLQVVATRHGLVQMWEPYAALRHLHKPVDLLVLNTDEHVLTNPAERMASQGGAVDWFRFWLKDEEDPDPAKSAQNVRWRELRSLQQPQSQKTDERNGGPGRQNSGVPVSPITHRPRMRRQSVDGLNQEAPCPWRHSE